MIIRPNLTIDAIWPVTQLNTLRLDLGIGYAFYLFEQSFDAPKAAAGEDDGLFAGTRRNICLRFGKRTLSTCNDGGNQAESKLRHSIQ